MWTSNDLKPLVGCGMWHVHTVGRGGLVCTKLRGEMREVGTHTWCSTSEQGMLPNALHG
jgi:hypothetical protein